MNRNGSSSTSGSGIQSEHGTIREDDVTFSHGHVEWDTRPVTAVK